MREIATIWKSLEQSSRQNVASRIDLAMREAAQEQTHREREEGKENEIKKRTPRDYRQKRGSIAKIPAL